MRPIPPTVLLLVLHTALFSQVKPDPINALNKPHKHAWDLFLQVNHPAVPINGGKDRGIPDLTKKIGDDGLTVWETWKLAREGVFREDGHAPGPWTDMYPEDAAKLSKQLEPSKAAMLNAVARGLSVEDASDMGKVRNFFKARRFADIPDGLFGAGGGETRMNKATFDFIVTNELYNVEGQEKYFQDFLQKRKPALSFPVDSIEVKAMWRPFDSEEASENIPAEQIGRFHVGKDSDGRRYGLVALHIITKDIPNWFWCSFRQIDGIVPQLPSVGVADQPPNLRGTKWEFYELSGSQTDFTDSTGRATLLSDPHIEAGFERSSCISCHAYASIGHPGSKPRGDRLFFFGVDSVLPDAPVGLPREGLFFKPERPDANNPPPRFEQRFLQLDFVFSLAFRARRKQP